MYSFNAHEILIYLRISLKQGRVDMTDLLHRVRVP